MGERERLPLILLVLGFGFTTWLAFLIRASRRQEPRWFVIGLLYAAALAAAMLVDPGASNSPESHRDGAIVFVLWLGCWLGGAAHFLTTRITPDERDEPAAVADPSQRTAAADLKELDSRRVGARLIDAGVILLAVLALRSAFDVMSIGLALFILWGSIVYFFVCELTTGQTLGKRICGLRVMKRDGTPPAAAAIAGRNIVRIIEEPALALIALVASRKRRQRIGDMIAGTTVGRAEGSHRPAPTPWRVAYPAIWAACAVGYVLYLGVPFSQSAAEALGTDDRSDFIGQVEDLCAEHDAAIHEGQRLSVRALFDHEAALVDRMIDIDHPRSLENPYRYTVALNMMVRNQAYLLFRADAAHDRRLAALQRQRLDRAYAIRASEFERGGIECDVSPPAIGAGTDVAGVHMVGP